MKKGTQDKAQKKVIGDFCSMTGASEIQSNDFLKRSNWNVQNAINLFFDQGATAQKKQIKQSQQINELFDNLSRLNEKDNIKQIDEQKFSQFVDTYFGVNEQNLLIAHVLINTMKVQKSGHIHMDHFYNLFSYLGCQSPKLLGNYVKKLQDQIYGDKQNFRNMYMKTFSFYLVGSNTTMDYEIAVQIWKLYLKNVMPFYDKFIEYCQNCVKKPNKVHRDLWRMVYEFGVTVKDINSIKQDDGWPVFLDDFVQYLKSTKMSQ